MTEDENANTVANSFDRLVVNGLLTIEDGVGLNTGLTAQAGQSFHLFDWQSVSSRFSTISLPTLNGGLVFNTTDLVTAGNLSITAVPEPSAVLLVFAGIAAVGRYCRKPRPNKNRA